MEIGFFWPRDFTTGVGYSGSENALGFVFLDAPHF
jgi:hypothetical protein